MQDEKERRELEDPGYYQSPAERARIAEAAEAFDALVAAYRRRREKERGLDVL